MKRCSTNFFFLNRPLVVQYTYYNEPLVWIHTQKKKTFFLVDFIRFNEQLNKNERKRKDKHIPTSYLRTEKPVESQGTTIPIILFTQPLRSGRIWHKVNF